MSSFTTPLVVSPFDDGVRWRVVERFSYHVGSYPSMDVIHVPVGFVTDFATVPKAFRSVIDVFGKHGKAAVIHDYLYEKRTRSRRESDRIFLEAMKVLGVPWWKRHLMYRAVRWFGRPYWNS